MAEDHTTEEAIRLALAGDDRAWEGIVEEYQVYVYRLAYRITFNEDDAMDAAQETFLKVSTQLHRFDFRGTFRAWLTTIAVREAAMIARRRGRAPVPMEPEKLAAMIDFQCANLSGNDYGDRAEILDRRRRIEQVHRAAEALSPQQRAMLLLGVNNDLGPSEIAREMNLPANQVRSQWARAVAKLRSVLISDKEMSENSHESL